MKESDRKFEKLLKEAVCSYHKEEMDALPSEEELQDIQLSDDFYRKMDGLVKKQKRRWQYRFVRYGAVAASFLLFTFGTVGAAAYALMGAENFKAFFKKHAKEYHVADSAVMDLEQLTDMAVTTAGTVYEDDNIRLDLKGLIKSGNRFSMIVEGTLKQQDQIVTAGGAAGGTCLRLSEYRCECRAGSNGKWRLLLSGGRQESCLKPVCLCDKLFGRSRV